MAVGMGSTACRSATGIFLQPATLYADSRTDAGDGFTNRSPQWAWHEEPVTFDFAPDPASADYAIYLWPDGSKQYVTRSDEFGGYFRGVGVFRAGAEPRKNTVRAEAYTVRGANDWYYDKDRDEWVHHRMKTDEADWPAGSAEMEIICYRKEVNIPFPADKPVERVELRLTRADGTRSVHEVEFPGDGGAPEIFGPDDDGMYHVRYAPTWKEVSRTGTTRVELVVTCTDGKRKLFEDTVDTP